MRDFRNRRNQTWVCPFQTCRVRRSCEVNRASSRALIENVAERVTSGLLSFMSRSCRPDLSRTCWTRLKGSPFRALAHKLLLFFALLFLTNFANYIPLYFVFQKFKKKIIPNFIQSSAILKVNSFFPLHLFLFLSGAVSHFSLDTIKFVYQRNTIN